MRDITVLDSGPLGMISNPKASAENDEIKEWLRNLLSRDGIIIIPESPIMKFGVNSFVQKSFWDSHISMSSNFRSNICQSTQK